MTTQVALQKTTEQVNAAILRFTCARDRLQYGLKTVAKALSKNNVAIGQMPLLGFVRMEAREGFLTLAATNLEIGITCRLELLGNETIQEGVVAVPAKLFTDLINTIPDGSRITLSVSPAFMLTLEHPRGTAQVKCMSAEEFLPIPSAADGELPVLLPIARLKEVIKAVAVAAARDNSIPAITALLVHVESNRLTFAATDTFRTAHQILALTMESGVATDLLIPASSLAELADILPGEGMVTMSLTPNRGQVIFHTQHLTLSSRLIEGSFPNYQAVIPTKESLQTKAVCKTTELRQIIQLASIYAASAADRVVSLSIKGSLGMEPGRLTVASELTEMGSSQNTITAAVEGEDQEGISFNARLLLDALAVTLTADVTLEIGLKRVKVKDQFVTAPAAVLRPVGSSTCTYSFMSMYTG